MHASLGPSAAVAQVVDGALTVWTHAQGPYPLRAALAQALGGSGFIAAFVGGLLFGAVAKEYKPKYLLAAEGAGDTLSLITWVVFGATVVGQSIDAFSWQVVLYAILSLTVVRMLPVFLVLVAIGKLPSNVVECLLGSGATKFGWPQWVVTGVLVVAITALYFVFQKRIARLLERWSHVGRFARPGR